MGQGQAEQTEVRVTRVDAVGLQANRRDPYRQLGRVLHLVGGKVRTLGTSQSGRDAALRGLTRSTLLLLSGERRRGRRIRRRRGAYGRRTGAGALGAVRRGSGRRARRGRSGARDELPARPVHGPGARASALRAVVRRASGRLRGVRRLCEHQSARYSGGGDHAGCSCVPLDSAFSKHEGPPCLVVFGSLGASCTTAVVSEMSRHHRPCPLSAEPRRRG